MNLSIIYGVAAAIALLLAVGYCTMVRKKENWLLWLYFSIFIANLGYFTLSISTTLEEALLANRLAYLGCVFLPLFMLMTILKVCKLKCSKLWQSVLLAVSTATFFVAASQGYLPWYYKEVTFSRIEGVVKLTKVYGPLHAMYFIYLLAYFALIIAVICYAAKRKKIASYKQAGLLAVVVLFNIAIWLVEQFIHWEFEFLAVSYIVSGLLLLFLYGMIQDYEELLEKTKEQQQRETATEDAALRPVLTLAEWPELQLLSARERDVLDKMLEDKKRKEIAEELFITENTVKKHTTSIFAKLGVANRGELFEKISRS